MVSNRSRLWTLSYTVIHYSPSGQAVVLSEMSLRRWPPLGRFNFNDSLSFSRQDAVSHPFGDSEGTLDAVLVTTTDFGLVESRNLSCFLFPVLRVSSCLAMGW